jgi:proline iminopeptidase
VREIRGIPILERRIGSGPPVVVLHGGPGAHHDYLLPGFDRLAHGRELIYYDQRGGGRSAVARDMPVGWTEHVADLEALREAWDLERLTIAGYSWGGLLALLYAIRHRERVERLALVSPAPAWRAAPESLEASVARRTHGPRVQEARRELGESGLRERDPAAYERRIFELAVAPYFHDPSRARDLTPVRVTGRTQQGVWRSLGDYDLRPDLPSLRGIPSLVLHGEDDAIPITSARATAELIGAEFVPVPHCGHVPYVEAPEAFVAALDPFLPRAR